jgi:hypothetical protein
MRLFELLVDPARRRFAAAPEMDALTETNALLEAQLQDIRFEVVSSTAWVLLDCRGALQIREGNTAVVVARGIHELVWHAEPRAPWKAWPVFGSIPRVDGQLWSLEVPAGDGGRLLLVAEAAEFWVGDVPGCDEAPPDFGEDDDATIRAGLAGWESEFEPMSAVFLDPKR